VHASVVGGHGRHRIEANAGGRYALSGRQDPCRTRYS
jgi:hypothetical protein